VSTLLKQSIADHQPVQGLSEADAHKLVETTHQVCPYSNATRGNVDVRLHTSVA
jgi:organic hydroperoxide reductase OsmC/OhrA